MTQLRNSSLTQSLTLFTTISDLKQTHSQIITSGLTNNIFITTRLLAFLAISPLGDLPYAKTLFDNVKHDHTLFMYNTMIRGFSQSDQPLCSIEFYLRMRRNGVLPDNYTFPFVFKACSSETHVGFGRQLHSSVVKFGLVYDVFVMNNVIGMYSSCGCLSDAKRVFEEGGGIGVIDVVSWTTLVTGYANSGEVEVARELFDEMPCRNVVSWNAMIAGYARCYNTIGEARELFEGMPERNAASWSTMISGYSHCGMYNEAFDLFVEMVRVGLVPNESALVSTVSACAQLRELEKGVWLHSYVDEQKFEINVALGTGFLDMYGKCGNIGKALSVFNEMPVKNVMSWNQMIAGLALSGFGRQALALFGKMQMMGPPPNNVTFIVLLSGCSHSGLLKEGWSIYEKMTGTYHIKPQSEHYGIMVDLLARAGLLKEALDFVEKMPVKPHPGLWGAIVGACRIHGDIELGERLGKQLIELEPHHSGRYLSLSNILAAAERWDDAAMVRNLFKERKVSKTPGNSMVGTGDTGDNWQLTSDSTTRAEHEYL
ncbi:hypothetical protein GIB67_040720 [Kingdonia uniflora]|uniref:Pentatricopeptide repeat-containing protein n=1 Tax=Kingdonia uniflora TaxID=39325 RepID=A0A7J7KUC5_9MAGN|nr:hypothetical protein GIB67_040720 [Kingdonia uniflora]